jgi:hypothetical protein
LGKKLYSIREKAIKNGLKLLTLDKILDKIKQNRG